MHVADVSCRGTESSLAQCAYTIPSSHCITYDNLVGVSCRSGTRCSATVLPQPYMYVSTNLIFLAQEVIANGKLRLSDGLTQYEGRVGIYRNSKWTWICSDGWDEIDAKVVCRQLNYLSTSLQVKGI